MWLVATRTIWAFWRGTTRNLLFPAWACPRILSLLTVKDWSLWNLANSRWRVRVGCTSHHNHFRLHFFKPVWAASLVSASYSVVSIYFFGGHWCIHLRPTRLFLTFSGQGQAHCYILYRPTTLKRTWPQFWFAPRHLFQIIKTYFISTLGKGFTKHFLSSH